jgi:hypothetical protein
MKRRYERQMLPISAVIVSDYEDGAKTWADELSCVRALTDDPMGVPSQVLVMCSTKDVGETKPPAELRARADVEITPVPEVSSVAMKSVGLRHCANDLIAIIEADCLPDEGWLLRLYEYLQAHPGCDVVSGRTVYQGKGTLVRVMSLLDRGYLEKKNLRGQFEHYSANGALFRRKTLDETPIPQGIPNPFVAVHLHHRLLQGRSCNFGFDNRAVIRHAFPSFGFIWDVRRNKGFQFASLLEPKEMGVFGRLWFAFKVARWSFSSDRKVCRALAATYCRRRDALLLMTMLILVRLPEMQGVFAAASHTVIKGSNYR